MSLSAALLIALILFASGGTLAHPQFMTPTFAATADALAGTASWYGRHWQGRKTASGVRYNPGRLTAAHPSLPLNTRVRVTNLENAKSVTVLINDRGPYVRGRVIDLSKAAARRLGMLKEGLAPVRIEPIEPAAQSNPVVANATPAAVPTHSSVHAVPAVSGLGAAAILLASLWMAWRLRAKPLAAMSRDG